MTESSAHGRPENPLGISGDSTERRQAEEHGPASQNLLRAISVIQSEFIAELEPKVFFEHLLTELLSLSKSAYGFIGEILWTNEGKPYLRTQAISNIAWNEETIALYKRDAPNLEFYNLDTLFGAVITSGKPVLANDPGTDPRRSGLPQGHPALNAFLGLPFYRGTKLVGMAGLGNRPGGYDWEIVQYLEPFLATCANIIEAYRNVQQRRQAEQGLRQSETQFRQVVEHIREVFWLTNPEKNQMLYVSPGYEQIWGRTCESLYATPKEWLEAIHPEDRDRILEAALMKQLTGEYSEEYRIIRPDGSVRWIWDRAFPIYDESGSVYRIAGTAEDITDRKRTELALESMVRQTAAVTGTEFFRSLVRALADSLQVKYAAVGERTQSPASRVRTLASWTGHGFGEDFEYDATHTPCQDVLAGRTAFWPRDVQKHFPKDRELVKVGAQSYLGAPIFSRRNEVVGHVVVIDEKPMLDGQYARPILELAALRAGAELERLRAEQALHDSEAKRIEALVRSDALKSALLSSVSHEFRTPLTVLKASLANFSDSYAQGVPGALEEFLLGANQDVDYLSHLVENLLNMSQIEAGALALKREWQPIEDLLEGPLRRLQGKLVTRTVTLDIPDGLPAVLVDGVQVQQVLLNLLDNAVKYSPTGSPLRVEARVEGEEMVMRVVNEGEGIPPEDMTRVFERFYRVKVERGRPIRGSGLGLAICRGLVEAHGGRIWAESSQGKATTITFTLPLHASRYTPPRL